jgi:hypothetical protein
MATYTDRLLVLSSSGVPTRIAASDTIELSLGNLVIGGDLTVKGDRIVNQSETVLLADNHTYVNAGYTSTVAQTGGLVVNYLPTATNTLCTGAGVFSAGVDGVSDPSVTTTSSAVFSAGDFIQISNTLNGQNDGLYEVLSHVGTLLKIRSTLNGAAGASDQVMDFTDGQFVAVTDADAVITKVNISVLRAGVDGTWESAYGSSTSGFTFLDLASVAGSSLQAAYESGNTIAADATEGDLAITVDSVDFKIDGAGTAGSVRFGEATALDAFIAVTTNEIDFTAGGAIGFTAFGAASLGGASASLSSGTGDIDVNAFADLDLDGATVHMDSTGQMDIASGADINMSAVGDLDLDGATVHVDSSGQMDLASGAALNVDAVGAVSIGAGASSDFTVTGDLDLSASADLDLDGATVHVDSSGQMDIASGADINMSAVGDLDLDGATVHVDSSGQMDLASGAALNVDAVGAVSIGAGASSDFTVTGDLDLSASADLDLDGATVHVDASGQMDIASGADINMSAVGDLDLDGATVHIDSSGQMDVASGADLNMSAVGDLDLDGATVHVDSSGQMDLASGAALNVDAVGAVSIGAGASSDFTVTGDLDLSASADLDLDGATVHMDSSGQMDIASGADINMSAVGDLDLDGATVHVDSSGQMDLASGAALNVDAVGAVSIGAGASSDFTVTGDLDLSASADLDLDGATVHVDSSGQMDIASGADINMSAVGDLDLDGATVHVDSSGQMDLASGAALNVDAVGAVSIGAGASSDFTVTGDLDLSASGNLDLDGASVDIDASGAFSIDGAAASNVSVTGADLTVSTITSGDLILSSAGGLDVDAVGIINFATGGNSIDLDPADDSIDVTAQGAFGVAAASAAFVIADNQADAFLVEDAAGVDYIKLDTSDGSEQIIFGNASTNPAFDFAGTGVVSMDALYVSKHAKFEEVAAPSNVADHGFVYVKADGDDSELFFFGDHNGSGKEVQITKDGFLNVQAIASSEFLADGAIAAGDALYIASATEVGKADATTADGKNYVVGFAKAGAADGVVVPMAALPGAVVTTGSIVGFSAAGEAVYLSETAGVVTVTAPTASGSTVYKVGYALTATSILFQPQLIALNP